jgi:amino acid adenylation domain-containing protein
MDGNIAQILEAFANSQPAAPAIQAPGRLTLTFADLGDQIHYVRNQFRHWGIAPGDVVASAIPTRPEMAVACAAIPATATFVPLSPHLETQAYVELLSRLRPKAILVLDGSEHPLSLAARRCGVAELCLVADASRPAGMFLVSLSRKDDSLHRAGTVDEGTAYITCTSGTTGRVKLVPISHRRSALFSKTIGDWSAVTPADVSCHTVPLYHGHGLNSALAAPLLRGASVVCLPEFDLDAFYHAMDRYRPTWHTTVFTMYKAIVRTAPQHREIVSRSSYRFFKVGSGALDAGEIDQLEQMFQAPVLSALIAQETLLVTHEPFPPRLRKPGSVGVPVCSEVVLLGDGGTRCSPGETGEIAVRGPLVFDGYLDDPEGSAAVLVDGWYRSGDLGRFDHDGYLFLEGRVKELIHRGGEKFAPARIDAALRTLNGVRAAAAFAIPHPTLGEEIAAAVEKAEDATIDEAQVIQHARQSLGPKGAPRVVYFVDALPTTEAGKIRRSELSRRFGSTPRQAAIVDQDVLVSAAGSSPLEIQLQALWSAVLQLSNVGLDDDFFLLGGDSLRGFRLLASVKTACDVALSLEQLLGDASTIAGMARAIDAARVAAPSSGLGGGYPRIPRRVATDPAPLSDTQRRIWFLLQLDPHSSAYNESKAYRLRGALDLDAVTRSLQYLVRRHEILRTRYAAIADEPRQVVQDDSFFELQTIDLTATAPENREAALRQLLLARIDAPFDLAKGPLLRCVLVRLEKREHVFLRVWCHIMSDAWSSTVFDRELSAAYTAFAGGRQPQLPPLPVQYADYAAWQRDRLQGEPFEQQLAYWKQQLAGMATLDLPTDRARRSAPSQRGADVSVELPGGLSRALREVGRRDGATLFMTLLAAFQVLLHRYSGQDDIAVGTPVAGRGPRELEHSIGFFANTLVLRSDLSGNPSFRALLVRVRDVALGAYAHQDVPFEKLVEELAPARDTSRNPLFQVSFTLQGSAGAELALDGLMASLLPMEGRTAKFDLTLSMRESEDGLRASWNYATDLFEATTIARMAEHFQVLLEAIVANPSGSIGELPLLGESEYQQVLVRWNDTAVDYPVDRCAHELFEAQVARTPAAIAVVQGNRRLTYAEVNTQANRLAHRLRALGVGPDVLVALCTARSVEMVVGLLGILKAGGAYVPIDPTWPVDRMQWVMDDARPVALVVEGSHLIGEALSGCPMLLVDGGSDASDTGFDDNPDVPVSPANLVYALYTSGTTGRPKGVLLEHQQLVQYVHAAADLYDLDPQGSHAMLQPLTVDSCQTMIFPSLGCGGTLHLIDDDDLLDAAKLGEYFRAHRIDYLKITPSHLSALLDQPPTASLMPQRALVIGGEAIHWDLVERLWSMSSPCAIWNEYGPTETTVGVSAYRLDRAEPRRTITAPMGRPLPNVRCYVLDRRLQPVPVGVPGELFIGGDQVARGYLNRPELTAARFVPAPFSAASNSRLYRTGDLVRYLPDGQLEFLGRKDQQVKIRGFRVELGEIEAILREIQGVRDSVVLVQESAGGWPRLYAFLAGDSTLMLDDRELRARLVRRLPEYMVPSQFIRLEQLPLMPHGKVDRQALLALIPGHESNRRPGVPPRDELEEVIHAVWCEVLRIETLGVHDNFFELGGHSLMATQVVARLSRLLEVNLPLRQVFEAPTIAELAEVLRDEEELTDEGIFRNTVTDIDGSR